MNKVLKRPRVWLATLALAMLLIGCAGRENNPTEAPPPGRPNFLLIITDDQPYDSMEQMPRTKALLFEQGVTFTHGYVTTPLCCPSRSSILTGMYAHTHNVRENYDLLRKSTVVEALHDNGYFTGLVGKYLTSYPTPHDDQPLPAFDYWAAVSGIPPEEQPERYDTRVNVNGVWKDHDGYQTYILRDYALAFLREAGQRDVPFFLQFSTWAPHTPAEPAPGDESLCLDLPDHRPPNFNPETMTGKPDWLQARPRLRSEGIAQLDEFRRKQCQALHAVDQSVEALILELERQGQLDKTVIIYLSDNGLLLGEHRLPGAKTFVYEESIKVPFALRYPPLVPEPQVEDRVVANIDIAPTIYDLAGLPIPEEVDGLPLTTLLNGSEEWRDALLIESWPYDYGRELDADWYLAIHTGRYVYVETRGHRSELYDLMIDPYQLDNVVGDPAYAALRQELEARLKQESRGVNPPPLTSRTSPLRFIWRRLPVILSGLWRTYRYSKKFWGGVGLIIVAVIAWRYRTQLWAYVASRWRRDSK